MLRKRKNKIMWIRKKKKTGGSKGNLTKGGERGAKEKYQR